MKLSSYQVEEENRIARLARYEAALRSIADGNDIISAHIVARQALLEGQ